ncbi:hypothetical protein HHS_03250 [Candidatus Pantoea carbekii]|uniref:Uncharacterized protein n=1 Tax=Candidatus Pantoea carbekii TaxID=1235990 RepID=U3U5Y2_9GAMM|nr:hypothetical protein HHS_03250 [Candidatus Pantoea carbekii]
MLSIFSNKKHESFSIIKFMSLGQVHEELARQSASIGSYCYLYKVTGAQKNDYYF